MAGLDSSSAGDFFVRSELETVKLSDGDTQDYIRTRSARPRIGRSSQNGG
jgi:hypothetical protein